MSGRDRTPDTSDHPHVPRRWRQNGDVPYVAVQAHKMLGDVAAVRMAVHLLADPSLTEEQRATAQASLALRLESIEEGLRALITAPREEPAQP